MLLRAKVVAHRKVRWCSSSTSPLPVCIVGAGPAGCTFWETVLKHPTGYYTAAALLQTQKNIKIDILERLPTPFGLVRSGVAPDHQEVV